MPCSFGLLPHPRSETGARAYQPFELTVTIRWIPLVTGAYGTRVARPARTTTLAPHGDGSQLGRMVRPVCGDSVPRWQAVKRARQAEDPRLDSQPSLATGSRLLSDSRGARQSWMGSTHTMLWAGSKR
jgi:hypothetical protein